MSIKHSTRTIPRQTALTSPTPLHPNPRPRPVHNSARQANRPLRVLLGHVDRNALRRDVECLAQDPLDLVIPEGVGERRDVRQCRLAQGGTAVRDVDHEGCRGGSIAPEEGGAGCEVFGGEAGDGRWDGRE